VNIPRLVPGWEWLRTYRRGVWPPRYGRQIAYRSIEQALPETGVEPDHPSPTP